MKNAIMIYGSTNTENLVGYLCRTVRKSGFEEGLYDLKISI